MKNSKIIIRNVFSNWVGLFLNMAVGFFMSPFLVHSLGDETYGLWILVLSLTGYMGLLDLGLKVAVVRYVSRLNAVGDIRGLNGILSTGLSIYCSVSGVIVLLTIGLYSFSEVFLKVTAGMLPTAKVVLLITGMNVAVALPVSVFGGILAGLQRYDVSNKIQISLLAIGTPIIVWIISNGFGIIALGLVHLGRQIVSGILMAIFAHRECPGLRFRRDLIRVDTAKSLYGYGGFILLNNLAMYLLFYSGEVLTGLLINAAAVTYYAIGGTLVRYLASIIGSMTQVLHPFASDQEARGNTKGLQKAIIVGTKVCLLIALPVGIAYILMGKSFIGLWMGPSYAETAGGVLTILAVGRIIWLAQSSTGNILLGVGKHRLLTSLNLVTGLIGIVVSLALGNTYGVYGVALGSSIAIGIVQLFVMPAYVVKVFGIELRTYVSEAYLRPLVSSVPYTLILLLMQMFFMPRTIIEFFIEMFVAVIVYIVSVYLFSFTLSERRHYFDRYLRFVPFFKTGA